jgi:nitrate/nitrite transport system substrate-binding protein
MFDKTGFTAETSQRIWKDHPEKALGTTSEFVQKYPNTARAMIAAILDASRYIDVMANRGKVAEVIAGKAYVNCPVHVIDQRLKGDYHNGLGRTWKDPDYMKFYGDGAVNFPYLSDGMWFLTQHKRWGLLKADPDYLAVATQVNQVELYKQAASLTRTPVPKELLRSHKLIDGITWDGTNPKAYAASFKVAA